MSVQSQDVYATAGVPLSVIGSGGGGGGGALTGTSLTLTGDSPPIIFSGGQYSLYESGSGDFHIDTTMAAGKGLVISSIICNSISTTGMTTSSININTTASNIDGYINFTGAGGFYATPGEIEIVVPQLIVRGAVSTYVTLGGKGAMDFSNGALTSVSSIDGTNWANLVAVVRGLSSFP